MKHPFFLKYGQSLTVNALKHLIDQSEERILRIDQSKNVSKYYVDHSLSLSLSLFVKYYRYMNLFSRSHYSVL